MLTSRPSGDGYNPVINAKGVEPFNYSTWHKIFPLCGIAGKSANAGAFYAKELGIKACLAVTARRGWHKIFPLCSKVRWHKIFPLCSKAKIAVLCHCMYDRLGLGLGVFIGTRTRPCFIKNLLKRGPDCGRIP